jgi:mannose-6-phosphate isomerase-like protein (cupin superfamily)
MIGGPSTPSSPHRNAPWLGSLQAERTALPPRSPRASSDSHWRIQVLGLSHGRQHALGRRLEERTLLGYHPSVHQNRKFAPVPLDHLDLNARFMLQGVRQTGGTLADTSSDRALPDRYLRHRTYSFPRRPERQSRKRYAKCMGCPDEVAPDEDLSMQHKHLQFGQGFRVLLGDKHSQAAQMTLAPGATEGGPDNRHRGADQWLFVVSGTGEVIVNRKRVELRDRTLLLIQRGEIHEIRNIGRVPLRTLNFYVPPAYTDEGDELPAGRSGN